MGVYLTFARLPEVANLMPKQRRFVKSNCLFWLRRRLPYKAGSVAIMVCCMLLASYAADKLKWGIWKSAGSALIGVLILDYVYDRIWFSHWRPEISRFIQLHAAEIKAAA